MGAAKKYILEEDNIIINCIKEYPTNLSYAFKQASLRMNGKRTARAIELRWYTVLKKKDNINIITVGTEKGFTKNSKNLKRNKEGKLPEQGLKPIAYLVKEILNLSSPERKILITFLKAIE